jgi:cytochrome c peroxidase
MFENSFDNDYFRLLMQHEQQEGSFWTRKLTHNGQPWMGPDQYEETGSAAYATNAGVGNHGGNGNHTSSTNGNNSSISSGISGGGQLCRLPSDLVLLHDPEFKKWVEVYAKDRNRFFHDFAKAFAKLLELGVPFDPPKPWWKRWFLFFL